MKKPSPHKAQSRTEQSSGAESPPHLGSKRKLNLGGGADTNHKPSDIVSANIRRRGLSFRLPAQEKSFNEEGVRQRPLYRQGKEGGSGSSTPFSICEEEELERLAGLQLRDTLVRSMGVGEKVRYMLESQPSSRIDTPLPFQHSDLAPPPEGEEKGLRSFLSQMFIQETLSNPPPLPTHRPLKPHHPATKDSCTCTPEHRGIIGSTTTLRDLPGYRMQQQPIRRNSVPVTDNRPFQLAPFAKRLVCAHTEPFLM